MNSLIIWTITLSLIYISNCNPVHQKKRNDQDNIYYKLYGYFKMEKQRGLQYCDRALMEALAVACVGRTYNSPSSKRSAIEKYSLSSDGEIQSTESLFDNVFKRSSDRFSRIGRQSIEIVKNCCVKPCTMEYMQNAFCPDLPALTTPVTSMANN